MRLIIFLVVLLVSNTTFSQNNYGNTWVFGVTDITFKMSFSSGFPNISVYDTFPGPSLLVGNSNICDSNGILILVSDGYSIYNAQADTIDGGYKLVPNELFNYYNGWSLSPQSSIFLPMGNAQYYFITPTASDYEFLNHWIALGQAAFDLLYYNIIDMKANGGQGKVVKRKIPLIENVKMSKSQMMACRHGDGKSWWLLKQAQDTNMVYSFLFTKDSVFGPFIQGFAEPHFPYDYIGQSVFSRDGTKFATTTLGAYKVIMADFDRCSGVLSNPKVYDVPEENAHNPNNPSEKDPYTNGLAFSPNGRFLYVANRFNIQQLDLQDTNLNTAWVTVAGLDTSWDYFPTYSCLYLGPDDKLYLGYYSPLLGQMSYFNEPDKKGAASGFCRHCLHFPGFYSQGNYFNYGVSTPPCMPNYKLGAANPICWPVGVEEVPPQEEITVYPNPFEATLIIKCSHVQNKTFYLYDSFGKLILTKTITENKEQINTANLAAGLYFYSIINKNGERVKAGKVVKE